MYGVMKTVLESKDFELKDALKKINHFWVSGRIKESEKEELITLAQNNARMENSIEVLMKLEELDKRMAAVENLLKNGEAPEEVAYPEYVAGKWYYAGDVVMYNGTAYKCVAPEGQVCVWNPEDYPAYWETV